VFRQCSKLLILLDPREFDDTRPIAVKKRGERDRKAISLHASATFDVKQINSEQADSKVPPPKPQLSPAVVVGGIVKYRALSLRGHQARPASLDVEAAVRMLETRRRDSEEKEEYTSMKLDEKEEEREEKNSRDEIRQFLQYIMRVCLFAYGILSSEYPV
jgi:hypothetical protein